VFKQDDIHEKRGFRGRKEENRCFFFIEEREGGRERGSCGAATLVTGKSKKSGEGGEREGATFPYVHSLDDGGRGGKRGKDHASDDWATLLTPPLGAGTGERRKGRKGLAISFGLY